MGTFPKYTRKHALMAGLIAVFLGTGAALSGCTNDTRDSADTGTATAQSAAGATGLQSAAGATGSVESTQSAEAATAADPILAVLSSAGNFTTFASAISASGFDDKLSGPGPFTVFAPTDQAFAKLPPDVVTKLVLPENRATLRKLLAYHVLGGLFPYASINEGDRTSLEGSKVNFSLVNGLTAINGSRLSGNDLTAGNGTIHGIDFVLVPPTVDLNTLGGIAPTPPAPTSENGRPLLDRLAEKGNFTTLLSVIAAAGLKDTLSGAGPFTVMAPTDEAFSRLTGESLRKLLLPENREALTAIARHHVIAERVNGRDLKDEGELTMLDGTSVKVNIEPDRITIDTASMTYADEEAANGVVHSIDSVLVPRGLDLTSLSG